MNPKVSDSDEYIISWGIENGFSKYPIAIIELRCIDPSQKNIAEVHYNQPGFPVIRGYSHAKKLRVDS